MQKGRAVYKQTAQMFSVIGVLGALCSIYWKYLNPGMHAYRRWNPDRDFMSIYREDFSWYQGIVLLFMAVSALASVVVVRVFGRMMGHDSLVGLVHESLRNAREKYGVQGEELWLQWWVNEVSKESERLQEELESKKFQNAGTLTGMISKKSLLPLEEYSTCKNEKGQMK